MNALPKPTASSSVAVLKSYLSSAANLATQEQQHLTALKEPSGSGQKYRQVYNAQEAAVQKLKAAASATTTAQLEAGLGSLQSAGDALDSQFNAVGLTTCGSGS